MREVLPELLAWWRAGETVGVGTVVATFQSAPRPPGASMPQSMSRAPFSSVDATTPRATASATISPISISTANT